MRIMVYIVDAFEVCRCGFDSYLRKVSEVEIIGKSATLDHALTGIAKLKPHVALVEPNGLKDFDLTTFVRRASGAGCKTVVYTSFPSASGLANAVACGAAGYVDKLKSLDELKQAIIDAYEEKSIIDSAVAKKGITGDSRGEKLPLTNRELQVLRHVSLGLSNRDIGRSLGISVETVKEHVQNILRKLDATDRTQAAVWAVKKGLV